MKEEIGTQTRIEKVYLFGMSLPTYFLDVLVNGGWKNHSSHSSYDKALKEKTKLYGVKK